MEVGKKIISKLKYGISQSVSQSVIETFRKNKKHSEKIRKIASSRLLVLFWNI